jgi:hypothetical protein
MTETINIVDLIEKNPITGLYGNYQSKILGKIQRDFSKSEQFMFVGSFYCYLNYTRDDFVIDIKEIWSWLGFDRVDSCKRTLAKHFIENVDYKISFASSIHEANYFPPSCGIKTETRGRPAEKITMNIETFKKLCMKSNTKKADEVHNYFVKLERIMMEVLDEESSELRMQLKAKDDLTAKKIKTKEEIISDQFPENTMCIYIVDIGIHDGNHLIKFGESNNLKQRMTDHRRNFKDFELIGAYKVANSKKFENLLRDVPEVKYRTRELIYDNKTMREFIFVDEDFTIEMLKKTIKNLIEKHCTIEALEQEYNFKKLELEVGLKMEEEKTKQDEIQLRKMEMEIRLLELKFQQNIPSSPSLETVKETPTLEYEHGTTGHFNLWIRDNLEENANSKILLVHILEKYDASIPRHDKSYYRKCIEKYINDNFKNTNSKCRSVKFDGKNSYGWHGMGFKA